MLGGSKHQVISYCLCSTEHAHMSTINLPGKSAATYLVSRFLVA